ncbi:caspase family protein [Rhizorhabdus phycosphaerae]|uniref:caspase family protein n=1 Tax=Rhizorhabdus phycosphaerae TaxID=2711156 RepID=UPI0013E9C5F2|nr:caspase family protein [Rhizorhabdus phycosphaerae]
MMREMVTIFRLALLLALPVAMTQPIERADARVRAVLVGASDFAEPELRRFSLPGAARDAERMADALRPFEISAGDMTVLTGRAATADAIRAALDALARRSTRGDRAIIFLSGHGTQAPVSTDDGLEPDGLDEWFLASDAGRWDTRSQSLPGGLKDDEIGLRVRAMRADGVDVWIMIDSCTGGGLFRGSRATPKSIDASILGIVLPPPNRGAIDTSGFVDAGLAGGGRLVAFAAAAPGQIAWDYGDGGRFTTALAAALTDRPSSFAALAARSGPVAIPWTAGDLSAPFLFDGQSPDLLGLIRGLPPLPFATRLSIDDAGACKKRSSGSDRRSPDASTTITLGHCDHVRVDFGEPVTPLRLEAWYRDASGSYASLSPPAGLLVVPGRWANVGFTFVTHDPVSGSPLPRGEEVLILLVRDGSGAAIAGDLMRFQAK